MSTRYLAALGGLPGVFSTASFRELTGVAPSSASRILRDLAGEGLVVKIRRATWRNLMAEPTSLSDWLVAADSISHLWTPEWETELEAVYGASPRRISGLTALGMAGVALICQREVSLAGSVSDTSAFGFASRRESAFSLLVGAQQVSELTWVSGPARAVLECAQYPHRSHRYEEYLGRMITNRVDVCLPSEVAELANQLGWRAGLRRLSSLAEGLMEASSEQQFQFDIDPAWATLATAAHRGDRWIHLTPLRRTGGPKRVVTKDDARKVVWGTTKNGLAEMVST